MSPCAVNSGLDLPALQPTMMLHQATCDTAGQCIVEHAIVMAINTTSHLASLGRVNSMLLDACSIKALTICFVPAAVAAATSCVNGTWRVPCQERSTK